MQVFKTVPTILYIEINIKPKPFDTWQSTHLKHLN